MTTNRLQAIDIARRADEAAEHADPRDLPARGRRPNGARLTDPSVLVQLRLPVSQAAILKELAAGTSLRATVVDLLERALLAPPAPPESAALVPVCVEVPETLLARVDRLGFPKRATAIAALLAETLKK